MLYTLRYRTLTVQEVLVEATTDEESVLVARAWLARDYPAATFISCKRAIVADASILPQTEQMMDAITKTVETAESPLYAAAKARSRGGKAQGAA